MLPSRDGSSSDLEVRLQRAWFEAEGLSRVPDDRIHPDDDMFRADVQGTEPERRRFHYMRSGHEALLVLRNALAAAGRSLDRTPSLLDFAGGYGRLLRFLVREMPPERIWSSDVLVPAVEFVERTFGVHGVVSAMGSADLRLPRRFSVVWVGSLFSHLPRGPFAEFLAVLYEALEPDGLLVFSTHSPKVLDAGEGDPSGFTFRPESESRILDPERYGTCFVEPEVVRAIGAELGIDHLWTLEQDLWRIQDVHVAARRPVAGLERWEQTPVVRGSIERVELRATGRALVGGWVRVPRRCAPVTDVRLALDGGREVPTVLLPKEGDLPPEDGGTRYHQTDWYVEGPVHDLGPGVHPLRGVGRAGGGLRGCFDVRCLWIPGSSTDEE